jgi:hypothetical protein
VGDLVRDLQARFQKNLKLWYCAATQQWTLRLVTQKPAVAVDWALIHPVSINQARSSRDLYSRVVAKGSVALPRNALAEPSTQVLPMADGNWFSWTKLNGGPAGSPAAVIRQLYDGDANKGVGVDELPGIDKYNAWYELCKIDLGAVKLLELVRAWLPFSANPNASAGHQGLFWPGLRLLVSDDDLTYHLASPVIDGRYAPKTKLEVERSRIAVPRCRYIKVHCGAFKQGDSNHSNPAIGLLELELYTATEYRVQREITGAGAPEFYSYTGDFDGDGLLDRWPRNHPDLLARLRGRHRTLFLDLGRQYSEELAGDVALSHLEEAVRVFQGVAYRAVCDPRVQQYQTVAVEDGVNGSVQSLLVEAVSLTDEGSEIRGADYLATALANDEE